MTKERLKELLPTIQHFIEGGNLWSWNKDTGWFVQSQFWLDDGSIQNIIGYKHFEARKAFALGEAIQVKYCGEWVSVNDTHTPNWGENYSYRVKPKEPVYEYQYLYRDTNESLFEVSEHILENNACSDWVKIEESRRIRK